MVDMFSGQNVENMAKISLTFENGEEKSAHILVADKLIISDDVLLNDVLTQMKVDSTTVSSCNIVLGANNIVVSIQDYTLTETIFFNWSKNEKIEQFSSISLIDKVHLFCQHMTP